MSDKKIIVIAGTYHEYKQYLRENNLSPNVARFVYSEEQIRGLREVEVVYYGTYQNNPLYYSDYLYMLERGM